VQSKQVQHAYAAKSGQYRALSVWEKADNGDLIGSLTLPLPVGFVGGSIGIHPTAQFSQRLLSIKTAKELESVIVFSRLGSEFSALRAFSDRRHSKRAYGFTG